MADHRSRRPHSHSNPSLHHQFDGSHASSDAPSPSPLPHPHPHPPRTHSHGAASAFLAQPNNVHAHGGQTWIDFLIESSAEPNGAARLSHEQWMSRARQSQNQRLAHVQQPHLQAGTDVHTNTNRRLPPLPHEGPSRDDRPAFLARPHSTETRTSSADRKRRLTTADSPVRRPEGRRTHEGNAGSSARVRGSAQDPIVLDDSSSPPRSPVARLPPPPRRPSQNSMAGAANGGTRRGSEFMPPPWQPDTAVSHCFVCGSQFTFFYRKHHCRKCGRVVCAGCSPHRITIPRQFIVHPPSLEHLHTVDLTAEDDDNSMTSFGPYRNPGLGGGEEVRVCNPCVPDPNYSPPPPYSLGRSNFSQFSPLARQSSRLESSLLHGGQSRRDHSSQSVTDSAQTAGHSQSSHPHDPFTDRRVSYHEGTRVADLWPPPQPSQSGHVHPSVHDQRPRANTRPTPNTSSSTPMHPSIHQQMDARSMTPSMMRRLAFSQGAPPPSAPVAAPQQAQATPRRQVPEEDECPICGDELPPKDSDGDDAARVQHVEECIAIHSGSPPPVSAEQTSQSLPSQRTRGMSNAAALPTGNGEGASSGNRLSMSARGMYPYTATEKDCLDDQGNEAECVICFEEFEPGSKMARLVCWCKFHEECIRQWWEKKGRGACPTHQLQY